MHYRKSVFRSLAMVTQVGLSVIAPVLLCIFIGYQIDSRTGMKTMVFLLLLGVLAGGRCGWQLVKSTLKQELREDEELRRSQAGRGGRAGVSRPKQPGRVRRSADMDETHTEEAHTEEAHAGNTDKEAGKDGMA